MSFRVAKHSCGRFVAGAAVCLVTAVGPVRANLDLDSNGMSDVWQARYNAAALDPAADANGDGTTNLTKSIAGVDPFAPNSALRPAVVLSGANVSVSWPTVAGKQYRLLSAPDLSGAWNPEGAVIAGTGAPVSRTLPAAGSASFFRVSVSDVDTNDDGLSDWEALQLGLSVTDGFSNGKMNAGGQPISDVAYVTSLLQAANVVTVTASKPGATVPSADPAADNGTITVTRTGNLNAITVPLAISGSAAEGTDYAALPRSVTFPFGVNAAVITVKPLASSRLLTGASAVVAAQAGDGYAVGGQNSAAVILYPSGAATGNGLTAQYYDTASSTYANAANFNPAAALIPARVDPTVDFNWGKGTPYSTVNRDGFSASWDADLKPTVTGNYEFSLVADDGARLYIDGVQVPVSLVAGAAATTALQTAPQALVAGSAHTIRVEYWEHLDSASVYLYWLTPGASSFTAINKAYRPGTTTAGWKASYYNNETLSGTPVTTPFESNVTNFWGAGSPDVGIALNTFSARWTGQVQPQYSEPYTFVTRSDDGAKLWINGQLIIDNWKDQGVADVPSAPVNLQAGVRYDIRMEYYQNTSTAEAHLSWYSPSQAQQIIPQNRLYPTSAAPTNITSATAAVALVDGPFNYSVTASNGPGAFTVSGLPPGLSFNPATGRITGMATQAGVYQVLITASNAVGSGVSALTLTVTDTGRSITREIWTEAPGTNIADIPVDRAPDITGTLTSLEDLNDYDSNYGERIRGYITAPVSGNYYFWIAGSDSAQLWIGNDAEPVNKVRRSFVANGAAPHAWTTETNQRSPLLALVAGQRYYVEILHKAGASGGGNISVGWLRPDQSGSAPAEIAPGYILSPYKAPAGATATGTLYNATLLPTGGAGSSAVGAASLRLSTDATQAVLSFSYSSLSSALTADHIDSDPYLSYPGQLLFDIAAAHPQPDGTFLWKIKAVGTLSAADVVEIVRQGKAYVNILTTKYPAGEIRGNLIATEGTPTFTPPPTPPTALDDHDSDAGAARFLLQSTFGPTPSDITDVRTLGFAGWINRQFAQPVSYQLPYTLAQASLQLPGTLSESFMANSWWKQSVTAADQLRQRVAFALSEITVISATGALDEQAPALSTFYDVLLDNAFGNYRDVLKAVTLSPAMGNYLNMRGNDKANLATGLHPNENYAREIMQLFSIGLSRQWPDGTLIEDSKGNLIPTYDQNTVQGLATTFTGWNYYQAAQTGGRLPTNFYPGGNYLLPMTLVPTHHDLGPKRLLDNVVLPPAVGVQADASNAAYDAYGSQDLELAIDNIFYNENVGPFVCRQLIQRLVTSNPSRGYLYRVVQAFADNGSGVRGDMKAVIRAILLDYEARSSDRSATFGKQREPLLRVTAPARFFASKVSVNGTYAQPFSDVITVSNTSSPHRLTNNDTVALKFTGADAPADGNYTVSGIATTTTTPANSTTFTIKAPGTIYGAYSQTGVTLTVNLTAHGLLAGDSVFLSFPTPDKDPKSKKYTVVSATANQITVTADDSASLSGFAIISKMLASGYGLTSIGSPAVQSISIAVSQSENLKVGDEVYLRLTSGSANGIYLVNTVPDAQHFTVAAPNVTSAQLQGNLYCYPLVAPAIVRTGACTTQLSTWNVGFTDGTITQTPLNAPTVFNYFFPDYRLQGPLAAAGLTTPEFQLTTDTNVMLLTNTIEAGILNASNQNGITSFLGGSGAMAMDFGAYLERTNDTALSALVDELSLQMTGATLLPASRTSIVNYVTTLPYSASAPTVLQKRDRIRAVVHLLVTSPEFAIQR